MSFNNNNRNRNSRDVFLVEREPKTGSTMYYQGSVDLGGGKMLKIRTFGNPVDIQKGRNAGKQAIVVSISKWKSNRQQRSNNTW